MPGNSQIGALRVSLGLDSAQFHTGLKQAQTGLNKFGVQLTLGLETVAGAVAEVAAAFPRMVKASIDAADSLSKSAQKIGLTVEALSRLKYAGDFAAVSVDQLETAFTVLSKNMAAVATGAKGSAATAFSALGISVKGADGTLRSSLEVFGQVADAFSQLENGATKTALATQVFGKSGADLIPLLNEGTAGLKRFADQSDATGNTISASTAAGAERFNDTLTELQRSMTGVINQITAQMLPALNDIATTLASVEMQSAIGGFFALIAGGVSNALTNIRVLNDAFADLAGKSTAGLQTKLIELRNEATRIENFIGSLRERQDAGVRFYAGKPIANLVAENAALVQPLIDQMAEINRLIADRDELGAGLVAPASSPESLATPTFSKGGTTDKFQEGLDAMAQQTAGLYEQASAMGMLTGEAAKQAATFDLMNLAKKAGLELDPTVLANIDALSTKFADATLSVAGAQLALDNRSSWEAAGAEIERVTELLRKGKIGWDDYATAVAKTAAETAASAFGLAASLSGALEKTFEDNKALSIATAVLKGAEAVASAYAQGNAIGGPIVGAIAAGIAGVAAIANVAAVASTTKNSTSVKTPSAGSAPVAAAPSNDNGGGNTAFIELKGGSNSSYSDDQVRELMRRLSELTADGYKVVLA